MKEIGRIKLDNNQIYKIIIIILLFITVLSLSTVCYFLYSDSNNGTHINDNSMHEVIEKNPDSIAIPGYESITLIADEKKQTLSFSNPEQNACFFKIRLLLEDGTLLYESDYISPGKTSKSITLKRELVKGVYQNAILEYSCFKMDVQKTPLNGAKTKLTLYVKE